MIIIGIYVASWDFNALTQNNRGVCVKTSGLIGGSWIAEL